MYYSAFTRSIRDELDALCDLKVVSLRTAAKAWIIVEKNPDTYCEESGMTVSEAADLACEMARVERR